MTQNPACTILILHSGSADASRPDELDTLKQLDILREHFETSGHTVHALSYDLGEKAVHASISELEPTVVFNLVESAYGSDALIYRATALLDQMRVAYTGSPTHCLRRTATKPLLKHLLKEAKIATPEWAALPQQGDLMPELKLKAGRYIVKSESEHGSLGMDASSVVDAAQVMPTITTLTKRHGGHWFAERFIDGREYNLSMLEGEDGPEILPIIELTFDGLPENLPRICDYAAKWDASSVSCSNLQYIFPEENAETAALFAELRRVATACWHACGLKSYARVDFRVSADGTPYVIDVNPNPCLHPYAELFVAAEQVGITPSQIYDRILNHALSSASAERTPVLVG